MPRPRLCCCRLTLPRRRSDSARDPLDADEHEALAALACVAEPVAGVTPPLLLRRGRPKGEKEPPSDGGPSRAVKNRASAARSRLRRIAHAAELELEVVRLRHENAALLADNGALRAALAAVAVSR